MTKEELICTPKEDLGMEKELIALRTLKRKGGNRGRTKDSIKVSRQI